MRSPQQNRNDLIAGGQVAFAPFMQEVFSLDAGIRWVALEEAGREPRLVWRDPETGVLHRGASSSDAELVDPLLLTLASGHEDLYRDHPDAGHRLLFVVLAYSDFVQIVAPFGREAQVSVAIDGRADAYAVGRRLLFLLDYRLQGCVAS